MTAVDPFFEHRMHLLGLLRLADVPGDVQWLPNPYWPNHSDYDEVRTPWMVVHAPLGPITIGWRKRVISIEWTDAFAKRGVDVVEENWITHWENGCHAYGYEHAANCLRRLLSAPPLADIRDAGGGIVASGEPKIDRGARESRIPWDDELWEVAWMLDPEGMWHPTVVIDGIPLSITVHRQVGIGPGMAEWGPRVPRPAPKETK